MNREDRAKREKERNNLRETVDIVRTLPILSMNPYPKLLKYSLSWLGSRSSSLKLSPHLGDIWECSNSSTALDRGSECTSCT
jgi:hypothetical protein